MADATAVVRHPVFARFYFCLGRWEPPELQAHRRELLAGLSGRVLEVGAGAGANFGLYPREVTELVAVEPEPYLRARAREAAAGAPVQVTVVDATADRLPAGDASVQAAVACLVLCSVADQRRALYELRRVLVPGGSLRLFEHVRSQDRAVSALQAGLDRTVWPHLFGGCHTARDTLAAVRAAGFEIERERRVRAAPRVAVPLAMHVLAEARAPA